MQWTYQEGFCWLGERIIFRIARESLPTGYSNFAFLDLFNCVETPLNLYMFPKPLRVFLISVNFFISCPVPQGRIKPEWLFFLPYQFSKLQFLLVLFCHPPQIHPFLPISTDATLAQATGTCRCFSRLLQRKCNCPSHLHLVWSPLVHFFLLQIWWDF